MEWWLPKFMVWTIDMQTTCCVKLEISSPKKTPVFWCITQIRVGWSFGQCPKKRLFFGKSWFPYFLRFVRASYDIECSYKLIRPKNDKTMKIKSRAIKVVWQWDLIIFVIQTVIPSMLVHRNNFYEEPCSQSCFRRVPLHRPYEPHVLSHLN